jgi:hypothetical protein
MDQPAYVIPEQVKADQLATAAEAKLAEADRASADATKFVVLAVVLALVLLCASIATKFPSPKLQVALIGVSLLLLGFCFFRMLLLPELL